MGWHTLKRLKSGEKKGKEESTNVEQNMTNTTSARNVQTLLAKALYDNVADAPDELTFRKGDIVTVLEQDVDGLVGWWLCLLHGEQGIVPGNRLKIISSDDLAAFERDTERSSQRRNLDGSDDIDDPSSMYDILPVPIKADKDRPPPLTLKEMFDIPYKKSEPTQEIYDVPKTEEVYDIPKYENKLIQDELYDIPRTNTNVSDELYDVPKTEYNNNEIIQSSGITAADLEGLDIYDTPIKSIKQNKTNTSNLETYDTPNRTNYFQYDSPKNTVVSKDEIDSGAGGMAKGESKLDIDKLMGEIYDSPFSEDPIISTIKRSPNNSKSTTPRNSMNYLNKISANTTSRNVPLGQEIYDTPTIPRGLSEEIYDIPVKSSSLAVSNNLVSSNSSQAPQEIYDTPKQDHRRIVYEETYDIPASKFSRNNASNNQVRPSNQDVSNVNHRVNLGGGNNQHQDIYDTPPTRQEIYDTPPARQEIYDTPLARQEIHNIPSARQYDTPARQETRHSTPPTRQEIYDTPPTRQEIYDTPPTRQEIYDIPPTKQEIYDTLPTRQEIYDTPPTKEEIYDIPPAKQEIYDIPPTKQEIYNTLPPKQEIYDTLPTRQEIYDTPPTRQEIYDTPPTRQEIYDTPMRQEIYDTLPTRQEIYDTPPTRQEIYNVPPAGQDIYDAPPTRQQLFDLPVSSDIQANRNVQTGKIKDLRETFINVGEDISEDIYDTPVNHNLLNVISNAAKNSDDGTNLSPGDDYVDYHDVWSNEPPDQLLHENKNLNSPGDPRGVDEPKRSILDQINFDLVKELEITSTEALEQLRKLHLAVDTCVQTLLSFWSENWLEIKVLKQTIRSIRDFSGKLKTALRLLTEFGLSTLINCTKVPRGEALMDKLIIEVEPLLESYYKIKICLLHLDSNQWVVPDVRTSLNEKFFATLNAIMILSDRIPELCKAFNLGVQNKVHELFISDPKDAKHLTPLLSFQPTAVPRTPSESSKPVEQEVNSGTLRREMADRRQQARDSTVTRPIPLVPPKPSLPNPDERKSLSGTMEIPESPRSEYCPNRGYQLAAERLVTDYHPEDNRHKKYASDPATPSCTDKQKTIWGGSCPTLMGRHSSALSSPHAGESLSSASSITASIPEETIEIKQTTTERMSKNFNSDSNIDAPLSPVAHTRSVSLPWDDRLKNNINSDEMIPHSPTLSPLDHRDIESLEFFCRQVESQVVLLRESMKNLTEAVENQEEPVVFVQYAKFISLTGHRVFHCGQDISERLINNDIKVKLKDDTAHLTLCIRGVVAATKTAAVEYPNPASMMEMISSVLALGDAVRIIYSVCRKALDS